MELTADRGTGLHGWTGPPKENASGQLRTFEFTVFKAPVNVSLIS